MFYRKVQLKWRQWMDAYEMDFLKLYAQHDENSKY